MTFLDAELSLQPVSPEDPCGPNLQYDADFIAFEAATVGRPEQQYGSTIIPAESPDWKEVKRLGLLLLTRTKDLRVACHLARAAVVVDGLAGFCACLTLIRGYVERYWQGVHPLLDPDDDNDPTERVNTLSSLADKLSTIAYVLDAPMVSSPALGAFSMRDVQIARGKIAPKSDEEAPDWAAIEAAFTDCDLDMLHASIDAVAQGYDDVVAVESAVTQNVGVARAVSLEALTETLSAIRDLMTERLRARQGENRATDDAQIDQVDVQPTEDAAQAPHAEGTALAAIRSREDVMRTLDRICDYYQRYEPSSPLPLLLHRAKRLVTKSFIDILEDLAPDGLSQARLIGGIEQSDGDDHDD